MKNSGMRIAGHCEYEKFSGDTKNKKERRAGTALTIPPKRYPRNGPVMVRGKIKYNTCSKIKFILITIEKIRKKSSTRSGRLNGIEGIRFSVKWPERGRGRNRKLVGRCSSTNYIIRVPRYRSMEFPMARGWCIVSRYRNGHRFPRVSAISSIDW